MKKYEEIKESKSRVWDTTNEKDSPKGLNKGQICLAEY